MTGAQEPEGTAALGTIFRVDVDVVVKLHGCGWLSENGCWRIFGISGVNTEHLGWKGPPRSAAIAILRWTC